MPLDVVVIERKPVPDGRRFWDVVRGILPRSALATAAKMQARAPRGKSGKLSRRVDVRVKPVNQGLVQGVEADFIVTVPYGHLVGGGHRIIPRGPARKGITKGVARGGPELLALLNLRGVEGFRAQILLENRRGSVRAKLRSALLERRGRGSIGFVPANPFASSTLQEDQASIVRGIEQGLTDAV
jgi:hypothetical protein